VSACIRRAIVISDKTPILGIDVGEDYLDVAVLDTRHTTLSHNRVPIEGIGAPVVDSLAKRIADAVKCDLRGALALVDSPRTPRDIDCSGEKIILRTNAPPGRIIDASLRELLRVRFNGTMRPLSMFPTPLASYFAGCLVDSRCKPHLRAIAEELFASAITMPRTTKSKSLAGGTFTRFMLAGFAAFPALERLGVRPFEAYPDLQMRLWSDGVALPPKKFRAEALRVRRNICARLAEIIDVRSYQPPQTLDEADAAVLALSAAGSGSTGSLLELYCPAEGQFAVAFEVTATRPRA
jgi:hypothetical protein